ncbi:hypothetical protein [Nocardioides sp.]|uniref:hypothetical protein n=1 Tax=Nocardioides sp. TaxID=35761 RepID=UPI0035B1D6BF
MDARAARARTDERQRPVPTVDRTDAAGAGRRRRGIRDLLRREEVEDGVFRPVRLPLWIDLGISAAIVVVVIGGFAGFIWFLASTQGR